MATRHSTEDASGRDFARTCRLRRGVAEDGFDLLPRWRPRVALLLRIGADLANTLPIPTRRGHSARLGPTRVTQGGLIPPGQVVRQR